ncbi:MAG: hypothetical protein AB7V44_30480 [Pseudonocardia sp.]
MGSADRYRRGSDAELGGRVRRQARPADTKAELLSIAQIGIIMTSRVDAAGAVRLAEMQARGIESW